jgi:hypothetical protein
LAIARYSSFLSTLEIELTINAFVKNGITQILAGESIVREQKRKRSRVTQGITNVKDLLLTTITRRAIAIKSDAKSRWDLV